MMYSRAITGRSITAGQMGLTLGALVLAGGIQWGFLLILRKSSSALTILSEKQVDYVESMPLKYVNLAVILSSSISLFLELAVIRWQGSIFPVFAFYKNFSLLACFSGLGLGYALAHRKAIPLILSIPTLALQMLLLMFLRYGLGEEHVRSLWASPFREQLNMGLLAGTSALYIVAMYSFFTVIFLLTTLTFLPIGQLCGRLMNRRDNLTSYGFNLLGSVIGVLLVSAVSLFWTPPVIWFVIAFAGLIFFLNFHNRTLLISILSILVVVVILTWPVAIGHEQIYTPYQLLEMEPGDIGAMRIRAAGLFYQQLVDLSEDNANRKTNELIKKAAHYYEMPYMMYGGPMDDVVVVGAGTGNDVAAALRRGAKQLDAIEIDPGIMKLGDMYHPEKPYSDPRVNLVVNDARTFLRTVDKTYDMIVYGILDSHTLLSHASSVRLDSFVYTVEGFQEARARLKDHGVLSLSFCVLSPEIGRKIYLMMEEAFDGHPPVCIRVFDQGDHRLVIFMQSRDGSMSLDPALLKEAGFHDGALVYGDTGIIADKSTDDWPFFYMPRRVYPVSYMGILALIMILSVCTTGNFFQVRPAFSSMVFFFLGAGFMLIETKAITEMGLQFGNTWHVIGIVIACILFMAYLANCAVQWFKITRPAIPFALLIASLIGGYFISRAGGFDASLSGKLYTMIVLTCPLFFSGIVFSTLLQRGKDISGIMAINILGAILGGLLEYNSMYFGFSFLYLLAAAFYVMAMIAFIVKPGKLMERSAV